ncbi:hypothetical protein BKA64DRAFT_676918 [Cadophora sp. MPI-SDFR-AT-0126]|nr:hypothetical protein BKA64DRAFT_676918 [Leotiomycetes sp. MPI-SDFR-AT-0126]
MNSEWSDQAARRPGFSQQVAPPDDIWSESDALLPGVLDADVPYMPQFEGSSFPLRPPHQNSGPQGYRGRPASQPYQPSYGAEMGNVRNGSSLNNASVLAKNFQSPQSWGGADNQASRQPTSQALGGTQDNLRREIEDLRRQVESGNRKIGSLRNELMKNRDAFEKMEQKWRSIEEKVMSYGNLEDLVNTVEGQFKRTMDVNNRSIKLWVQAAVAGIAEETNGGTGEYKNGSWGEQMEGGDGENQDGTSFDFMKGV